MSLSEKLMKKAREIAIKTETDEKLRDKIVDKIKY